MGKIIKHKGKSKKRKSSLNSKVSIKNISKCNPSIGKKDKCLPDMIMKQVNNTECGLEDGHCILDKIQMDEKEKNKIRNQYLRPRYPKEWINKPDTWLDNVNIENVMRQYERQYDDFKFVGVFPIDFASQNEGISHKECLYKEMCSINLDSDEYKLKRIIGVIFNLDPHDKSGSHWVAGYINNKDRNKPFIGYFDSYGYSVPKEISEWMKSFKLQKPKAILGYNGRRYQYSNTECGMFSLYFLICMIEGISFQDFCRDNIKEDSMENDKVMLELRKIIFSK